jgi:hypothetical protein
MMKDDNSLANGGEPPADHRLQSLKEFHSAGRGFWHDPAGGIRGRKTGESQTRTGHHAVFFQFD